MSAYVFVGPSLPVAEARVILDAVYLPPVAMGDLYELCATRARPGDVVAIIDGFFEQVPAVWHKEILFALSRGVRVYGAASMGALRAAELHPFGMVGVGAIFDALASGELTDDDEVVVVHGPAERGYRPLSEAMVNVRAAIAEATAAGVVAPETGAALVAVAKRQYYAERTWGSVLAEGAGTGLPALELAALREWLKREKPDAKRRDAIALVRRVAAELETRAAPAPDWTLEETTFWIGLTRARAATGGPSTATVDHVRALAPDREELWRGALLLYLAAELGGSLPVTRDEINAAALRLCRRHGLRSHGELAGWRAAQGLSAEGLARLLELEARLDVVRRRAQPQVDGLVALELQRQGRHAAAAEESAEKWRHLERLGLSKPTLEDAGVSAETLQRWYERRCGRLTQPFNLHVEELGFHSLRDFVNELIASYMLEERGAEAPPRKETAHGSQR